MILACLIISVIYLFLIGSFVYGFDKIKTFSLEDIPEKTTFSIIIPFRNEAENILDLLQSIKALNYPKTNFEVILIDDASEDDSVALAQKFLDTKTGRNTSQPNIKIIENERTTHSPKKDAINLAINQAKNEWIVTTDADCILPKYWLDSFDEFIQKHNTFCIAGPVAYHNEHSFLNRFQILDMLSLQGATLGGFGIKKPFLCNGANFAYKKTVFKTLNGFEGNTKVASGDDIFFLEKVAKTYPKQLHYLKCEHAIVTTKSQPTYKALISQRIRWAAKSSTYNNLFGKITGLIVLLMNAAIIIGLLLAFFGVINFKIWSYMVIIKFNIDLYLIYKSASFYNQKEILTSFITSFVVYPFFSVFVALSSFFSGYTWKGRTFKK